MSPDEKSAAQKSTLEAEIPPLSPGDRLTWEEFELRWNAMPNLKFAELIGGRVYMPPPLSAPHGEMDASMTYWVSHYAARTSGLRAATNATCRMMGDAPQPDVHLRSLEEYGGKSAGTALRLESTSCSR